MAASAFIHLRVTQETKLRLRALAQREGRTESALLKELLGVMLRGVGNEVLSEPRQDGGGLRQARLTVRLHPSDQVLLRDQGEAANGIISFSYWTEGADSAEVQKFVQEYESRHGEIPSLYAAGSYLMAQVIAGALEATGGQVDGENFVKAAQGLTFDDSVYGPIAFDDTNNIVGGVNREHVEARDDGKYWNVVDETIPDVSQFWTYGKDAFLANPVFSRDFTSQ